MSSGKSDSRQPPLVDLVKRTKQAPKTSNLSHADLLSDPAGSDLFAMEETESRKDDETGETIESPTKPSKVSTAHSKHHSLDRTSNRQQPFEDRARNIFAKYNLIIQPEWIPFGAGISPESTADRVHKPIRIRVHHYCHRCETAFDASGICVSCEHQRCSKCLRLPSELNEDNNGVEGEGDKTRGKRTRDLSEEKGRARTRDPLLIIHNPRTGSHVTVHNRVVHRVRRRCHKCSAQFLPATAQACAECGHVRCTKCPQVSKKPWQVTHPDDKSVSSEGEDPDTSDLGQERVFRKLRQRVRRTCDQCSTLFTEGQKACTQCGHERCGNCQRMPPKKSNRESFDSNVVHSLDQKLSALVISASAS